MINNTVIDYSIEYDPFDLSYDSDYVTSSDIKYKIDSLEKIPAECLQSKDKFIAYLNDGGFKAGKSYTFPDYFFFHLLKTYIIKGRFTYCLQYNMYTENDVSYSRPPKFKHKEWDFLNYKESFDNLDQLYDDLYDTISSFVDEYNDFIMYKLPDLDSEDLDD